ncbi:hypothetical protein M407DRAFT_226505 [Tulasnella calospora MUT 4182]|uniref:Uncharacterized protein n=1 Tax=Tulasnella calospora MUT 4182 TaxID=1051891 RepID=A0A0C3M7M0_9AGAM|nr:hypothetical protein M407DRAFT_226505 [Tulasnella calospora MUT 4182]
MPFLRPAIQNLAQLKILTFRTVNFDGGRWLPNLGNCCPHLRWLIFTFCIGYTIPSIRLLVETRRQRDGINPLEILCIQPFYDAPPECWADEEDAAWFSKFLKFKDQDDCWQTEPEVRQVILIFQTPIGLTALAVISEVLVAELGEECSTRRCSRSKIKKCYIDGKVNTIMSGTLPPTVNRARQLTRGVRIWTAQPPGAEHERSDRKETRNIRLGKRHECWATYR